LQTISDPEIIYEGDSDEYIALAKLTNTEIILQNQPIKKQRFLIVVYKQDFILKDGFGSTAFISSKLNYLSKKKIVWQPKK